MATMVEAQRLLANLVPWRNPLSAALCLLAALCTGCVSPPVEQELSPALAAWPAVLQQVGDVRWQWLADGVPVAAPPGRSAVVLTGAVWPDEVAPPDAAALRPLRAFVEQGGHLLLFGHAAALVHTLGIEGEAPEREVERWGFDARTARGDGRLGLQFTSGRLPELLQDVPTVAGDETLVFLAGGQPHTAALCQWRTGAPQQGEVLARACIERDGRRSAGAPALLRWSVGQGAVLACGVLPDLANSDPAVAAAAAAFVRQCTIWAGGQGLVAIVLPPAAPSSAPSPVPTTMPLLAHWGWIAPPVVDGVVRTGDEVLADVVQPSWLHGADALELQLVDDQGQAPLRWRSDDLLKRAPSYREPAVGSSWRVDDLRRLPQELHARGLLAIGGLAPLPVGERAAERFAALRFFARELADRRGFGEASFDAFVADPGIDPGGIGALMLQDFQPAGVLLQRGELAPAMAGAEVALDADDGMLPGLPVAGIAGDWRRGFPAARFPHGTLDARAIAGDELGAFGSGPDWLVQQCNDFVRARAGHGALLNWRTHAPASHGLDTVAMVHGLSLEPLRAAVAMPLSATGVGGLRAAAAALFDPPPGGFAGGAGEAAVTHVVQNNWLRLAGSGGSLVFDPSGRAEFAAGALSLSPSFLRTRLFGGRPDGSSLRSFRLDWLANGQRGPGGYAQRLRVGAAAGAEPLPPRALAAVPGEWPTTALCEWFAEPGYHQLELELRSLQGRGIVAVALDGVLLQALPFGVAKAPGPVTIPVHVATGGPRRLELTALAAGTVAIDRLLLHRVADVGVEAAVAVPAGARAELHERSQSSYHHERLELVAQADFPGFVLRLVTERAVRNLQVERTLTLPGYDTLAAVGDGDEVSALRQPFVLRSTAPWPDLVVVPLQLARHETVRFAPGELRWHQALEAGLQSRIGFWLCPHGRGDDLLPRAALQLGAIDAPLPLSVGEGGEALLAPSPIEHRLLEVSLPAPTPFLVREGGFWSWRGSSEGREGARWLRVHQEPGDAVALVAGPAVLARPHPAPGSLRRLRWRQDAADAFTVQVVQASRLAPAGLLLAHDFANVLIDGQPWHHRDGRTVYLPDGVGTFSVNTIRTGEPEPHVRRTGAPLRSCHYVPSRRELVLTTVGPPGRPAEQPWVALLGGPVPTGIENGEVIDDNTLRLPDAERLQQCKRGGVLIRFRNGITKVRYGEH